MKTETPKVWMPSLAWRTRRDLEAAKAAQLFVYKGWVAWEHPTRGDEVQMLATRLLPEPRTGGAQVWVTDAWDRESFEEQVDEPALA